MKVFLATDHTGLELKEKLKTFLTQKGFAIEDCGAYEYDKDDDYPDFISKAARGVSKDPENTRGIIFGGSGQGEAMVANKFKGVRCAVFYTPAIPVHAADITGRMSTDPYEILRLSREHNNANMLSIGFRFVKEEDILKAVEVWLATPDPTAERHVRRVEKIKVIEDRSI
ncbi:MAG TPA: RpiB/LacA/LacB family sugar-phosphate isomerase [Candidatus Saccharimonadales bacterium]|nr:RpiB/LacA/LacB family sugar-phosphate isomerase [Candidatus Saccharimonadales bacterium]